MQKRRQQKTLASPVSFSGIGLHTGEICTIVFHPAKAGSGIQFSRVDLPGRPTISAKLENVVDTQRNTTLSTELATLWTVEHVLSAIAANEIDNLLIEIDGIEPPIGNGSSDVFVDMLKKAGIEEQDASVEIKTLSDPIYHREGDIYLVALPSDYYRVTYTLNYAKPTPLQAQFFDTLVEPEIFNTSIAPCRSFGLFEEVEPLLDRGLIKGCSLSNSVVVDGDVIFSKNGLFFANEMARHKVLDLIGDLSLVGFPFTAHIIAVRSGHTTHKAFAEKLKRFLQ